MLSALALPSLVAAVAFALAGAWPILPLAGLELAALGSALYVVCRKLEYRQVITLSADTVAIDQGFRAPRQSWRLARRAAALAIAPGRHPWEGPDLTVHDHTQQIALGQFLNREEQLQLLQLLRQELRIGAASSVVRQTF